MADIASRDSNRVPTLLGVSSADLTTPTKIAVNPSTGAVLIDSTSIYTSLDARYNFKTLKTVGSSNADYLITGTNDQTVVQAAAQAVLDAGGGALYLKGASYNFSSGVNLTLGGKHLFVFGDGLATQINNLALTSSNANSSFNITGAGTVGTDFIGFDGISLVGNSTGGMGIRLNSCYQGIIANLRGRDFTAPAGWGVALNLNQSIDFTIINPIITGCNYAGIQLSNSSNANQILGGWLYNQVSGGAGLRVSSANKNVAYGTILETNTDYGAIFSGGRFNQLINCWLENNGIAGVYSDEFSSLIDGSWFTLNTLDIDVRSTSTDIRVVNNRFNDGGKITIQSGAARVNINDNINLTTVTDNGGTSVRIRNNDGFNPEIVYAQGNVTGATTFNRVNGNVITATLTGNITVTLTNGKALGDTLTLILTQDATGGRTATWPGNALLAQGGVLNLSNAPSATDVITFQWNGSNWRETSRDLTSVVQTLFDHSANAGNVTTGETDLYSDTTAASTLARNGDKIEAEYGGVFVSSGTATREVKVYFGGTAIFDTGALTLSLSSAWTCYVTLIRVSSTVVRYMISFTTEGAALAAYTAAGELTGLTLSNTNILKITGQAAGVGAATNDIVAKLGTVSFFPAA